MAINLQKGQKINIGLSKITVGLGWDPNEGTGYDFDLDASAFMIDANRLIPAEEYFVFYGNTDSPDQALHHTGDDPTGGNSATGDDESIQVDLSKVDDSIQEILFVVTIHDAVTRKQNYGQVRNSYIRIVDDSTGEEVAKYELGEDFSIETGVEFGRLYKRDGQWKFEASGIGYREDLSFFLSKYFKGQIIK
ncbi:MULTISPECIES: TerD family protein [Pedobacter]|uniref:TerD family protein n=1 Tax=Pedobacter agri TaxID=454586 RepID=A0A9X3D9F8_9SPHI|nr:MULTISPECIES: TerD family protein [Pedobacter]AZI26116.1 TerD family protein [Pedobacter sp. G11]MCX3263357.1 TerD family protein [Pedobacter agri]MDQ1142178.1 tellurium resistance protein TerD [Pedobacter agri]